MNDRNKKINVKRRREKDRDDGTHSSKKTRRWENTGHKILFSIWMRDSSVSAAVFKGH